MLILVLVSVLVLVIVYFGFGFGFGYSKVLVVFTSFGFGFVLTCLQKREKIHLQGCKTVTRTERKTGTEYGAERKKPEWNEEWNGTILSERNKTKNGTKQFGRSGTE